MLPGKIGRLARHRVTIEQPGTTRDALGEVVPSWTTVAANVPAEVRAVNAREVINADQQDAIVTHVITVRYLDGVTPLMRVSEGSRSFHVEGVTDPDGYRRRLVIKCREYVDGQ